VRYKVIIVGLLLSVLVVQCGADYSVMTLDGALAIAVSTNEQIRIQSQQIVAAEAEYNRLRAVVFPTVSFIGSESFQDSSGFDRNGNPFTASHRPDYRFTARQSVFGGMREWDALAAQKAVIEREKVTLSAVKRALYLQVSDAYFDTLLAQKQLENIRDAKALYRRRSDELSQRILLGKSRNSEKLSVETQLLELDSQEKLQQFSLDKATIALSTLLKVPPKGLRLSDPNQGKVGLPDMASLYDTVEKRAELVALHADKRVAFYQKRAAQHGFLPSLSVGGNYYLDRVELLDPIKWDADITFTLPLYNGGRDRAAKHVAEARLHQLADQIIEQRRGLKNQILTDYLALKAYLDSHALLKDAQAKTSRIVALSQDEYRMGLINNLEVLQVMNSLLTMTLKLDIAVVELYRADHRLKLDMQEIQ
jgi:outer membrane protein TolC